MKQVLYVFSIPIVMLLGYISVLEYIAKTRPVDDGFAIEALVRLLRSKEALSTNYLDLGRPSVIQRDGEAIIVGQGHLNRAQGNEATIATSEKTNFHYTVVVTRDCREIRPECYNADDYRITAQTIIAPDI